MARLLRAPWAVLLPVALILLWHTAVSQRWARDYERILAHGFSNPYVAAPGAGTVTAGTLSLAAQRPSPLRVRWDVLVH